MSGMYADNKAAKVVFTAAMSILVLTNLIGNTLIILIILTNKSMKSPMNYLLINLAVADMMVGVFFSPSYIFMDFFTHPDGLAGTIMCKLLTGEIVAWTAAAASIISLVAISFERYFAVVHPYSTKLKLDILKVKRFVVFCWIFAVVLNIPLFVTITYNREYKSCTEAWPKQRLWLGKAYSALWFVFSGIMPATIMVVLYSRVIHALWFKRSKQGTQLALLRSRKRLTKMMVIVSVIYCVCWLPISTLYLLEHHDIEFEYMNVIDIFYICAIVLVTCNSSINPFIYALQSERFRRLLKELVSCRKLRRNCVSDAIQKITFNAAPEVRSRKHFL